MSYENLLESLSNQAKAERDEILAAARKKAEAIVKAAVDGVEEKPQVLGVQTSKGGAKDAKKENAPQRRRISKAVLQAQYEFYLLAIEKARKSLEKVCEGANFSQMLKKLLQEATAEFQVAAKVMVRPQDVAAVKGILDELNLKLEIVPNQDIPVGVVVCSQDGKLVRHNTLNSRLEKALPHLSTQIAKVLYG